MFKMLAFIEKIVLHIFFLCFPFNFCFNIHIYILYIYIHIHINIYMYICIYIYIYIYIYFFCSFSVFFFFRCIFLLLAHQWYFPTIMIDRRIKGKVNIVDLKHVLFFLFPFILFLWYTGDQHVAYVEVIIHCIYFVGLILFFAFIAVHHTNSWNSHLLVTRRFQNTSQFYLSIKEFTIKLHYKNYVRIDRRLG